MNSRIIATTWAVVAGLSAGLIATVATAADIVRLTPTYAITTFGDPPLYPDGFERWNYVNANAPQGGNIVVGTFGSFDTLNQFTTRGDQASGLGLIYSSLGTGGSDEVTSTYGSLAESYELSEDRLTLVINLRDNIYFHDQHPITSEDVVFSYEILRDEGSPSYRIQLFADVDTVEALDDSTVLVRFSSAQNPETPHFLAGLTVLPKHYWEGRDFDRLTMEPPLGSGEYRIADIDGGRSITYERVRDWWGAALPRNTGVFNFDRIHFDYYLDNTVRVEAFKAGRFDYFVVNSAKEWMTGFQGIDGYDEGNLILQEIESSEPEFYQAMFMNTRRPLFQDLRIRHALSVLFDFETIQRTTLFGLYRRTNSYFPNSEFGARDLPDGRELEILEQFRDRLPDEVFTVEPVLPVTAGDGNIRASLRQALGLLRESGWEARDGRMTNVASGERLSFEIIYGSPVAEAMLLAYKQNLERAGIDVDVRFVDGAQWGNIFLDNNYDLILGFLPALYPPGGELRDFFGSATVEREGSQNLSGVRDEVLDELIELVVRSDSWDERVAAARAFDRYLRHLHVSIPLYYNDADRIAYWDMFDRPETRPRFGIGLTSTWWFDPSNPNALRENR